MDESFAESMRKLQEDIENTEKEVAESLGLPAPSSSPTVPELKRNRDVETEKRIYKSAKKQQSQNFDSNFFPWSTESNASNFENGIFPGDYCRIVLENSNDQDDEMIPKTTKSSLFPKNTQKDSSDDISMAVQWRYSLGDPPSKKFGTKEWIEFQKHKWNWQLGRQSPKSLRRNFQPQPLKKSLFTKKSFINEELDSNLLLAREQWRCYLGDPPPKKYVKDWIVFQKAKWDWQREQRPENSDSEEEDDEEEDEETRNFDLKAKNKIFNIFANVLGSLAISNNTERAKRDGDEESHEKLFDGLKASDVVG